MFTAVCVLANVQQCVRNRDVVCCRNSPASVHAEIKQQPSDIRHDQKVQTGPRRMGCLSEDRKSKSR